MTGKTLEENFDSKEKYEEYLNDKAGFGKNENKTQTRDPNKCLDDWSHPM